MHNIVVVKFKSCRILVKFERTLDISKIVIFKLEEAGYHLREVLLVLLGSSLVGGGCVALLLDDACGFIKRSAGNKAFLTSCTLDI